MDFIKNSLNSIGKISLFVAMFFALIGSSVAQINDPVKWSKHVVKISDSEYKLVLRGTLDHEWNIYSQYLVGEDGPQKTMIKFDKANATLQGKIEESGHKKEGYDELFAMNVIKFYDYVEFTSLVKVKDNSKPVTGTVFYMTCDNEQCLPPKEVAFSFDLNKDAQGRTFKKKNNDGSVLEIENTTTAATPVIDAIASAPSSDKETSDFVNPTAWSISTKKVSERELEISLSTKIQDGWNIYSQNTPEGGPIPTTLTLEAADNFILKGKVKETGSKMVSGYEPIFEMKLTKFKHDATFTQTIEIIDPSKKVKGSLEYQACDDSKCLNPTLVNFEVDPASGTAAIIDDSGLKTEVNTSNSNTGNGTPVAFSFDRQNENHSCDNIHQDVSTASMSLWWIFVLGFAGGLLAILTPCVFPMIPLTVSYFTKGAKDKKKGLRDALLYGLSIIVIYIAIGLIVTSVFGADALNQLSTNPWLNIGFCILFIIFAFSFFGYYEITLPASWVNSSDKAADKGGLIGIFFMAFTLSLVSFSCTGPIIGSLLVQTVTGGGDTLFGRIPLAPLVGMFGFSLALALPFAFFAAFPAWLHALPKSGSWMNTVKVSLGFIEIALALKFLSIADLTMGWKILPYELFLGVWVLCALALCAYFMDWFRFPHDTKVEKLSTSRLILALASLAVAIYMSTGFMKDNVSETFKTPNLLSGIAPPAGHSYIYPKECPLDLECYHDFYQAVEVAKKFNKPILVDFTGYGCVNCRRMEDLVWSKPGVFELIKNEYVLVSLYTDDKKSLEKSYISTFDGREMKTVGNKWADFEAIHFNRNSQPFYVLISPDGKLLNKPVAYTPDVDEYKKFLQCGVDQFKKTN